MHMELSVTVRWTILNRPSTNNTSSKAGVIGQCVLVGVDAKNRLNSENIAALDATAGQTVLASWYNALSTTERRKLCYAGRIASKEAMSALPTLTYEWEQPRLPSRLSFKDFQAAKASGAIVFQKHQAGRFTASYSCGFVVHQGATLTPGIINHHFHEKWGWEMTPFACSLGWKKGIVSKQRPNWNVQNQTLFVCDSETRTARLQDITPWMELNETALRKMSHDIYQQAISGLTIDRGLVTSLRSEANSGSFDLLTEVAEFPETVKWLYGLLREIISLFRKTKRQVSFIRKDAAIKDVGDKITSLWMQYRYAVTPLVHSVADGLSLLEHEVVKYQSFRQGLTERKTLTLNGVDIDFDVVHRCVIKHRYGLDGLRLSDVLKSNLLSTSWELVPLSWAVDWALNIGNLLSALQLPSNVDQENSCYSWRINATINVPMENNGILSIPIDFYKRTPIEPLTHIGLDLSPLMNAKRSLDSMSLAWQMFIRKKI